MKIHLSDRSGSDPAIKPHGSLRIALVADELTQLSLSCECKVMNITPLNYRWMLRYWKPDLLLVESAWAGYRGSWKYKIASYPSHPGRSNMTLRNLVYLARERGIPSVFWNKEDGVHFERFIESAKLFDHIFTTDENCVDRYRAQVDPAVTVNTLMFAVQPAFHSFAGFNFSKHRANFTGSYSCHIHPERQKWQDMLFGAACKAGLQLTVIDRNSGRKSWRYRYPSMEGMQVSPAVRYDQTAHIYRNHLVSLNVNTVENSPTMFSRRLVEILACGGIAVSTPCQAIERYFRDYCHVVRSSEEASELFARLKHGPTTEDLERAEAGACYVRNEHTWMHRLQQIMSAVRRN